MKHLDHAKKIYNKWADDKFGYEPIKPAAIHLLREVEEYEAVKTINKEAAEELIDCWFLAIHIVHRIETIAMETGVDIAHEARLKFKILKERKWLPPDAEGVIEHDRSKP